MQRQPSASSSVSSATSSGTPTSFGSKSSISSARSKKSNSSPSHSLGSPFKSPLRTESTPNDPKVRSKASLFFSSALSALKNLFHAKTKSPVPTTTVPVAEKRISRIPLDFDTDLEDTTPLSRLSISSDSVPYRQRLDALNNHRRLSTLSIQSNGTGKSNKTAVEKRFSSFPSKRSSVASNPYLVNGLYIEQYHDGHKIVPNRGYPGNDAIAWGDMKIHSSSDARLYSHHEGRVHTPDIRADSRMDPRFQMHENRAYTPDFRNPEVRPYSAMNDPRMRSNSNNDIRMSFISQDHKSRSNSSHDIRPISHNDSRVRYYHSIEKPLPNPQVETRNRSGSSMSMNMDHRLLIQTNLGAKKPNYPNSQKTLIQFSKDEEETCKGLVDAIASARLLKDKHDADEILRIRGEVKSK